MSFCLSVGHACVHSCLWAAALALSHTLRVCCSYTFELKFMSSPECLCLWAIAQMCLTRHQCPMFCLIRSQCPNMLPQLSSVFHGRAGPACMDQLCSYGSGEHAFVIWIGLSLFAHAGAFLSTPRATPEMACVGHVCLCVSSPALQLL